MIAANPPASHDGPAMSGSSRRRNTKRLSGGYVKRNHEAAKYPAEPANMPTQGIKETRAGY